MGCLRLLPTHPTPPHPARLKSHAADADSQIPPACPLPPSASRHVKDADKDIVAHIKAAGRLVDHSRLMHSYPFCWRSDTPLIYRAVPSWFVKVGGRGPPPPRGVCAVTHHPCAWQCPCGHCWERLREVAPLWVWGGVKAGAQGGGWHRGCSGATTLHPSPSHPHGSAIVVRQDRLARVCVGGWGCTPFACSVITGAGGDMMTRMLAMREALATRRSASSFIMKHDALITHTFGLLLPG
jgi:valyl-tRNA synthetase